MLWTIKVKLFDVSCGTAQVELIETRSAINPKLFLVSIREVHNIDVKKQMIDRVPF